MAIPTSYLTSLKNVDGIFTAIRNAQAPQRFTTRFLESLGFPSANDRLVIGVLKSLGMLSDTGQPTAAYHEYLDPSRSSAVLATGIRRAYAELFQVRLDADQMSVLEVKNKLKTLSQGQYSDAVLQKMASTFKALAARADFTSTERLHQESADVLAQTPVEDVATRPATPLEPRRKLSIDGLIYNINIYLPESRDPAVYDALFRSLREHLG